MVSYAGGADILNVFKIALVVVLTGCGANYFASRTTATYEITKDGKIVEYSSNKEQQGLLLEITEVEGRVQKLTISVDKTGTPDAVVAAATQMSLKLTELIAVLIPLLEKAAMAGS